ncbi:MAG TPA: prepilin-type N-terminal cleavage/methylation domain-containing protein [Pyrinomonadaceae bacterium]|nr:prepilin-type N-terminal cleavage/methylation domain-containing protein [Pyrinomonadaceae bacterium]
MKRQRMNNKGFTLIETAVAMLVMLVVGLGASSLFLYSVRYNSGGTQRSNAMAIAQQRLELLHTIDYYDARLDFGTPTPETATLTGTATTITSGTALPAAPAGSSYYQIQTEIVPFPIGAAAATATQKQIRIRVVSINNKGAASWDNVNPVEIVFRRSSPANGPFRK